MQNFEDSTAPKNLILASLPSTEYEWLQPKLKAVELQQSQLIYQLRERISTVYFPTTCLLSWTNSTAAGDIVKVGITGSEGVTGVPLLSKEFISPWRTEVQLSGQAFQLSAEDFVAALDRSIALRQRVAAFAYLNLVQLNQAALCNRFHSVEERLCRWLLAMQDYSNTAEFFLTREILAEMSGAGRPTVSLVTRTLHSAGLIRAKHNKITILNREGMEEIACECYQVVKAAVEQYLAKQVRP